MISLYIPGRPVPQGSLRAGRQGQLFWSNAATLRPYRANIAQAIRDELGDDTVPVTHGVHVEVDFRVTRPKSHFTTKGKLRNTAPLELITSPDFCDKGSRAVLDAITDSGVVYRDDAQVTRLVATKAYASDFEPEGTYLRIIF